MNKHFKRFGIFLFTVAALYGVGRLIDVSYGSYVFVERQPYMVMQTKDSITLKWQTPKSEIGSVSYGFFAHSLNQTTSEQSATDKHLVTLENLSPCTKYFYRVESDSLAIDNDGRSFSTLCDSSDAQRVWIIGDSGKKGPNQQKVYEQMRKYINYDFNQLDMWLLLGDNAYSSGTQKQYNETMFEPYIELVKRFVPWSVIGNHDARRWAYYNIWDFPTKGQSGGVASGSEKYYAIDNGNIHFVMLDNETTDLDSDADMANWLRKDLEANTKPWVVVAFHSPPYTDGGHNSDNPFDSGGRLFETRENLVPIFNEFGVDLVLSGHSHGYERSLLMLGHTGTSDTFTPEKYVLQTDKHNYTKPNTKTINSGTIYQVCGSSSKLDGSTYKHPAMPIGLQEMGSLILEVTPTTLTSKFLNIDGEIKDYFTITKTKEEK